MVWLNYNFFFFWNPWIFFFNEIFFLQFIIFYFIFLIFSSKNLYYLLFYIFVVFFYFGLFLAILNLDLFTAFLWLTECVVVFVSVILLFYLNIHNSNNYFSFNNYSFKYYGLCFFFFFINLNSLNLFNLEFFLPNELNLNFIYDNFYESLFNNKTTDFYGLFVSYYYLNNFEYLLIGFILLIGSLICVNLNKLLKFSNHFNYNSLLSIFDFFYDFTKFYILRKQNLINQNNQISFLKILKKKNV